MGLPIVDITFKTLAATAIARSQKGIVALILKDDTGTFDSKEYKGVENIVSTDYTAANLDYIKMTFKGTPSKVIVERIPTTSVDYSAALNRLKYKHWNYLAVPGIQTADVEDIASFIKGQRANNKKTYKAVLPDSASDDIGVINFTTDDIKTEAKTYTNVEYCARLAGIFAGLPYTRSATYFELPEVISITPSETPDADIDAGKLILISGAKGKVKIARAVNSFTTFTPSKSKSFSKIAVVEVLDQIQDDVRETFENDYVGKVKNSYTNKILFVSSVNGYLEGLAKEEALDPDAENKVAIDIAAIRTYLKSIGKDADVVDAMKDEQVKRENTDSNLFVGGKCKPLDAIEDLKLGIAL